jgi:hypothetical protein
MEETNVQYTRDGNVAEKMKRCIKRYRLVEKIEKRIIT